MKAAIRETWIVDLVRAVVEVYLRSAIRSFRAPMQLKRGQRIAPIVFPRTLPCVSDVLGSSVGVHVVRSRPAC